MKNNEIHLFPEQIYHIYNHANGKENLFEYRENYLFFLRRYSDFVEQIADTFAYCLMPNHIHLMVRFKTFEEINEVNLKKQRLKDTEKEPIDLTQENVNLFISKEFGSFFSSYSQAFNKQQGRRGSLFIPNFKRKIVDSEEYYKTLIRYIHSNPVHHGFTKSIADWEFSSYLTYLVEKKTKIKKDEVIKWFGNKDNFKEYHQKLEGLNEDFEI